jgi:hypothetical protein
VSVPTAKTPPPKKEAFLFGCILLLELLLRKSDQAKDMLLRLTWIAKEFFDFKPLEFAKQFDEFYNEMRKGEDKFSFWFRKKGTKFVFEFEPTFERDGSKVAENLFELVLGLYKIEIIKACNSEGQVWYDAWIDGNPSVLNEPDLETLLRRVWAKHGPGPLKI